MRRLIVVCNALDDVTRLGRGISTDSPAASRKVFLLCMALRQAGVQAFVLSLGRGKAGRSLAYHRSCVRRVRGIPVVYAPFSRLRGFSELLSFVAPAFALLRFGQRPSTTVMFYNREIAYVPILLVARFLGIKTMFDLEDGEVGQKKYRLRHLLSRGLRCLYDKLCPTGALLACSALAEMTTVRPVQCYYGTAQRTLNSPRWQSQTVSVVLGGTLSADTGADMLVDAIRYMRQTKAEWTGHLSFHITGKGPSIEAFRSLAGHSGQPHVSVHGRITDEQYRRILAQCEIGLALKPRTGELAQSTFPSKVIEMASAGLLVVTTDISDVRKVFGEGAIYLKDDDAIDLVRIFRWVVEDRIAAQACGEEGSRTVWALCAPQAAGRAVADFVFGVQL